MSRQPAPIWQRVVAGVLALGGGGAFVCYLILSVLEGKLPSLSVFIPLFVLTPYGAFLFGYFALRGELPHFFNAEKGE
jgi:hypothetical protein